jgi:hypothetical protein
MDLSIPPKDEIQFLGVCHHISTGLYSNLPPWLEIWRCVMYVRTERQLTYRFQPPGPACWTAGISTTPNNSALLEFLVTKRNMQYCKTFNRTEGRFIEATPCTLVPFHDLPTRWLGRCLKTLYVQTSTYLQHKKKQSLSVIWRFYKHPELTCFSTIPSLS